MYRHFSPSRRMQFDFQSTMTVPSVHTLALDSNRNPNALRNSFLTRGISVTTFSWLIESHVLSHASQTAFNPVIDAPFAAVASSLNVPPVSQTASTYDTITTILRRFTEACEYFQRHSCMQASPGHLPVHR
ncbi:hypothetical protein BDR05DRAFT_768890 [Suillus weaverae]|nr:hypothetical protein BDR05DRAFT_768890 [Suillus weaverae]